MKHKYFFILSPIIALVLYLTLTSNSTGVTGASTSGCAGGSCHGTVPSTNTSISVTGLPASGYVNGAVYSITLTITNTAVVSTGVGRRDGFDMTASAGSFTAITGTSLSGATEIRHNTPKLAPTGVASWTFNWTAPATGSSVVTFNIAGNAANGDGGASALDQWKTASVTVSKALSVTATASPAILCNGGTTTITAASVGGAGVYTYSINGTTFQSATTFASQLAGTYTVTVKDAALVTATTLLNITQPTAITFAAPTITSPLCNGGTGSASITATGGTGTTKTYTITPLGPQSNTTGNFTTLTAQTYTVTCTDANSCTKTTTIAVTQPTLITFNAPTITNPLCNGGTGSATITATGGTGASKTYTITPLGPQSNTAGNFSALTPQTYTVTCTDANNCTKTSTITITQPALLTFNTATINNPICNGGTTGTASITATGGTGTKTYTITPLGPQSNTTGNFSGLSAQTYTITCTDANSCTKTTTILLTQPAALTVTASNVSGCAGAPIALSGSPSAPPGTGTFSVANPYTGPSTTFYTYTYADINGCSATSLPAAITINPVTNANIATSASGPACQTLNQSGSNQYGNSNCQMMASINASGLGSTNVCVNFLPGFPSHNGEPYAGRVYSITPTIQPVGSANVCLYYTPTDLSVAGIANDAEISISKVSGNGNLGVGNAVQEILNSSMTINTLAGGNKEVCFPVSSFSSFYLHSVNPNNIPLPVSFATFTGMITEKGDELYWETGMEFNNDYFIVEHSTDGKNFSDLEQIKSKSDRGNSSVTVSYAYTNVAPVAGRNYYRLRQVDLNGNKMYSSVISLVRTTTNNQVIIYPNPTHGEFNIQTSSPVSITITDMNGKKVFEKKNSTGTTVKLLHSGIYSVKLLSADGTQTIQKLVVN